ncbi:hypothetical protein THIAE_06025 [Thiomicrospira aerophila AL3]|uniref:Uncharacterized protein n=1 Tax=Thiomicrospira aerophila AL3 TaxID=717772 RepID=W0DWZ7_9GAMM|nr:hypothetical protein [Thiomicrospira aerophila]AHF01391.1 hypothetical protein THIAE_06025 [Thiomicrospira aerophila AL3]
MDYRELLVKELNSIAKHYVEHWFEQQGERIYGEVLIFEGRVTGWTIDEPPFPYEWRPGTYAVSKDQILLAVGGNDADGAEDWITV